MDDVDDVEAGLSAGFALDDDSDDDDGDSLDEVVEDLSGVAPEPSGLELVLAAPRLSVL